MLNVDDLVNDKKKSMSFGDKITEAILGDEAWEKINTIGWTVVLMGWLMSYYFIGAWSFLIIVIFAFIIREISNSRKAMLSKFYKYSYFKLRVWEDDHFNYEIKIAFSMMEVYPLTFKNNIILAQIYINSKNGRELVKYAKSKLKQKQDLLKKLNDLETKLKDIEKAKEEQDTKIIERLTNIDEEDTDKTIIGGSPNTRDDQTQIIREEKDEDTNKDEDEEIDDEEDEE